jgi:hypothetical protein
MKSLLICFERYDVDSEGADNILWVRVRNPKSFWAWQRVLFYVVCRCASVLHSCAHFAYGGVKEAVHTRWCWGRLSDDSRPWRRPRREPTRHRPRRLGRRWQIFCQRLRTVCMLLPSPRSQRRTRHGGALRARASRPRREQQPHPAPPPPRCGPSARPPSALSDANPRKLLRLRRVTLPQRRSPSRLQRRPRQRQRRHRRHRRRRQRPRMRRRQRTQHGEFTLPTRGPT